MMIHNQYLVTGFLFYPYFIFCLFLLFYLNLYDKLDFRKNGVESEPPVTDRKGIFTFGGISQTYQFSLKKDLLVIVWDFHSLLVMVQMFLSFMLTDKNSNMHNVQTLPKSLCHKQKGK